MYRHVYLHCLTYGNLKADIYKWHGYQVDSKLKAQFAFQNVKLHYRG